MVNDPQRCDLAAIFECATYDPKHGDRVRVLLEYQESMRAVIWFELSQDGSVYLGPRKVGLSELRHGVARRLDDGQLFISSADGEPIVDPEALKSAKLSFHGSGVVNAAMGRMIREPIREIRDQQLMCFMVLQHPTQFASIAKTSIRKTDVCLRFPIAEDRPLWAYFYVAPRQKTSPAQLEDAAHQVALLFEYDGLANLQPLTLQVLLWHGPTGPWPMHTYVAWGARGQ